MLESAQYYCVLVIGIEDDLLLLFLFNVIVFVCLFWLGFCLFVFVCVLCCYFFRVYLIIYLCYCLTFTLQGTVNTLCLVCR